MNSPREVQNKGANPGAEILARFVILGAAIGLVVGLWEARLLYFVPSVREFIVVDATYVVWFLAPLVDVVLFGLLGAILGCLAALGKLPNHRRSVILAAVLIGCAGAHIGWANHFVHAHAVDPQLYGRFKDILFPLIRFAIVFPFALLVLHVWRGRILPLFSLEKQWPVRKLITVVLVVLAVLTGGVAFYSAFRTLHTPRSLASASPAKNSPNIVLITMDTVRADHLPVYGYDRPTTPNIDRFAAQGVLFENAIAATSWTLPSLASIFTGLLPHQSGANSFRVMNPGWATIGSVLEKHGYATAGFNANVFYGQSGWGLGHGFGMYDDDPTSVSYNLSRTLVGRTVIQPLYQRFGSYNMFFRRDAAALNADIFRWFRHRSARPFYVYINYFDAHSPYVAPPPYNRRFGKIPESVLRRWGFAENLRPAGPVPAAQRAELMRGYDDCLAYIDAQIAKLIQFLRASGSWKNTIAIITADHGESFGEHRDYQHGCDLHREEIHVPLIVFGAGIPAGGKVKAAVPIRDLFSTVLDLALGNSVPMHQYSLARYWEPGSSDVPAEPVVSELSASRVEGDDGELSLTTAKWHYILKLNGEQELYNWATDAAEKQNLSSLAKYQKTVQTLHAQLQEIIANSYEPWLGREYLFALGEDPSSWSSQDALANDLNPYPERVGAAQAYFRPSISLSAEGPPKTEKELLDSLPYQ